MGLFLLLQHNTTTWTRGIRPPVLCNIYRLLNHYGDHHNLRIYALILWWTWSTNRVKHVYNKKDSVIKEWRTIFQWPHHYDLFYPWWETSNLQWPAWRVVAVDRIHCIKEVPGCCARTFMPAVANSVYSDWTKMKNEISIFNASIPKIFIN